MGEKGWDKKFLRNFIDEMKKEGLSPQKMTNYIWKPFLSEGVVFEGEGRDKNFKKVAIGTREIKKYLQDAINKPEDNGSGLFSSDKYALVIYPGFLHHMQRNPVFVDKKELRKTPVDITKLSLKEDGSVKEENIKKGDGLKVAYVFYPRSNAACDTILDKGYRMISGSPTLRRWVEEEKRKIIFLGFSYGSPLILETLSKMNSGEFKDDFILKNTVAFLAVNGAIGGSYLADALLDAGALINVNKFKSIMDIVKPLGWPLGIKSRQERDDLPDGLCSLGHEERQKKLKEFGANMPSHIKYFSIASVLPLYQYSRRPWNNADGLTLFFMSLISYKHTVFNDGQVGFLDAMIPEFPGVPEENIYHLGAVKSHHWGVGYRTMNLGRNKYPRLSFYRALARTLKEAGLGR